MLEKFALREPTAVFLTEGWGGVPNCDEFDRVLTLFAKYPMVRIVWAPVYVTNHQQERHTCFAGKIGSRWNTISGPNHTIMDLWDLAKNLDDGGAGPVHIPVGGSYMIEAHSRFSKAILNM